MNRSRTKVLIVVLAVLIVAGLVEYTAGGGWVTLYREYKRWRTSRRLVEQGQLPWTLPQPIGPKDAKVKLTIVLNTGNPCHKDYAESFSKSLSKYADRIRVEFLDFMNKETADKLQGYPISCEMAVLLNGLNSVKVPWRKAPIILQGPTGGENISPEEFDRIIQWALTEEGQKSLKKQFKQFEAERKKRIEREQKLKQADSSRDSASDEAASGQTATEEQQSEQ